MRDLGDDLAFTFDVTCETKREGKIVKLEIKADNARLEVRAEFSDESDQSYDEAIRKPPAGRWIDTVQVRLHEQGGKPRDVLFLKFITYEGTFGRRPLSWQLDYMAKRYEARIDKKIPFARRGLNFAANERRVYAPGTATEGILSALTALLSDRGISRKPEAECSRSGRVRDDRPGPNGDPEP